MLNLNTANRLKMFQSPLESFPNWKYSIWVGAKHLGPMSLYSPSMAAVNEQRIEQEKNINKGQNNRNNLIEYKFSRIYDNRQITM